MLAWERVSLDALAGEAYLSLDDRTVCQSRAWLEFLEESQAGEAVVAELRSGTGIIGFFTGLLVRKFGMRILGSPFPGWTTSYMGFSLAPGVSRREALRELVPFCFDGLHCAHLELMDRELSLDDVSDLGLAHRVVSGFEIDLTRSEDELLRSMKSACRRCISKAARTGVTTEVAMDSAFADEYYAQLRDVFARQSLVPTYGIERVRALIRHILPTGELLLLRAREPGGTCIATGIFPGSRQLVYFWGGASWRKYQQFRPNEALQWHAICHWKRRGTLAYDMGGGGEYKRKYGGCEIAVPWLRKSKYRAVEHLRGTAWWAARAIQRLRGWVRH
jgi:hypothetical protein